MEKTIGYQSDIDDVWAEMSPKERKQFINENLSDGGESELKAYCLDEEIVTLNDFDDDDIIEYLEEHNYYVTQNPPTE